MSIRALRRGCGCRAHGRVKAVHWACIIAAMISPPSPPAAKALEPLAQAVVFKVQGTNERLEMVVNSSRILTMDQKVPQVQAANPDVVELTPLSATQVQLLAKKAGVTQVNLWDENQKVHVIDVVIFPDARELSMLLQSQFPTTALRVVPTANSVILSGHVDDPNQISRIIQIAEDFYPKVINNITIAGVQQVLLKVKVMEVSRTKLRQLGFDFRAQSGQSFFQTAISNILGTNSGVFNPGGGPLGPIGVPDPLMVATPSSDVLHLSFGIVNPNSAFLGFLDALEKAAIGDDSCRAKSDGIQRTPGQFLVRWPVPRAGAAKLGHHLGAMEELRHAGELCADRAGQWRHPAGSVPQRHGNRPDARRRDQRPNRSSPEDSRGQYGRRNAGGPDAGHCRFDSNATRFGKARHTLVGRDPLLGRPVS